MQTTTIRPSRRPRRGASASRRRRAFRLLVALVLAAAGAAPLQAETRAERPVLLMTGLPLAWGEVGPFDSSSRPARAWLDLSREFGFEPVDVLDAPALERGGVLFLAQPQRLAPAELAALDGWIREGGRALILTDPMLTWPTALPPGDIRRPPSVGLLRPLLHHWRLALDPPAGPGEVRTQWDGREVRLESPGRLRSASGDCVVAPQGWTAVCRLGRGRVRIVADADLLGDSAWQRAENHAVVRGWLDELTGTRRPEPRREWRLVVLSAGLLAGTAAIGLSLRRRRKR